MASTFSELKAEIASYTLRSESEMPLTSFIALAESELQPIIRHYEQETSTTLTSDGDEVALPTNLIEIRRLSVDDTVLKPMSIYGGERYSGEIGYFRVGNTVQLVRDDTTDVDVEVVYRSRFTPLSDAAPTNWLLTKFPTVYHHAVMAKAYHWLKDPTSEQAEIAALQNALSLLNEDNRLYVNSGNQLQMEVGGW